MFTNFNVRSRLMLILMISCLALLSMGALGWFSSDRARLEIDHVYLGGVDKMQELQGVQSGLYRKVVLPIARLRDGLLSYAEGLDSLREARSSIEAAWKQYGTGNSYLADQQLVQHRALVEKADSSIKSLDSLLSRLQNDVQRQDKEQLNAGAALLYPIVDSIDSDVEQLLKIHVQDSQSDYAHALETSSWLQIWTVVALLIALAILIPLTLAIIRSIAYPLEYASERISEGDTAKNIEIVSGGELGHLLEAIKRMFLSLDKVSGVLSSIAKGDLTIETSLRSDRDVLGHALHNMVAQMRLIIGRIKEEVNTLGSSSQEIMTSISHISTGATETASAVTETTTTIEELKQTAHISVDKAQDVASNAQETLQAVTSSETSIDTTLEEMTRIREKMQTISDTIIKLSEKGLAIAEIMDTVNDIAEQSNLLAVNAAIQAAKDTGEVGRSFGVVAQEIRTLAEQSKSATIQVRTLLADIQNATSAAVLATEQGSKAVSKGVDQSKITSQIIKELAGKMTKVTQAASQIVLSNQQQLVGTEQITVAMSQISEATNQHVEQLRQIESAVSTLNQVGTTLKDLTDNYILTEGPEAPTAHQKAESIPKRRRTPRLLEGAT